MILSHEHRFLFLKTRKTAGTSVECALSAICGPNDVVTPLNKEGESLRLGGRPQNYVLRPAPLHIRALRVLGVMKRRHPGEIVLDDHEPYDGIVAKLGSGCFAGYRTVTIERNPWDRQVSFYHWRKRVRGREAMTFEDFLRDEALARINNFEIYSSNGTIVADMVMRYESLEDDLHAFLRSLGIERDFVLPKAKQKYRGSNRTPYRDYYTARTKALVGEWYRREIAALGYTF
jgi:hypothetical protein